MAARAIFVDRDGTVCDEVGYINHESRLRLLPRSAAAIRAARAAGFRVVVVTNQAGVARGYFAEEIVTRAHERMHAMLAADDAAVDAVYYCPHHPDVGADGYRRDCDCRKPNTGMLESLKAQWNPDTTHSFMLGDADKDAEAGNAAGLLGRKAPTGAILNEVKEILGTTG